MCACVRPGAWGRCVWGGCVRWGVRVCVCQDMPARSIFLLPLFLSLALSLFELQLLNACHSLDFQSVKGF